MCNLCVIYVTLIYANLHDPNLHALHRGMRVKGMWFRPRLMGDFSLPCHFGCVILRQKFYLTI